MSQPQTATSSGGESFAALFEESLKRSEMRAGEVITAEVVRIDYNFVVVNAGLKSEAYVPIEEFKTDQGEVEVQVGDFVSVAIDAIENGYGDTILSRDKAKRLASWMALENALESGDFVSGTVSGKVKGEYGDSIFPALALNLAVIVALALDQERRSVRPCGMRQATRSAKAMRMPARIAASSPSRMA